MVAALIVIVAIVAVFGFYILATSTGAVSKSSTQYASATVSGTANTNNQGATPLNILFTDKSGKVFNATITNNQYSVVLPTNQTYFVQFRWLEASQIIQGAIGTCQEGSLNVTSSLSHITENWSC